MQAEKTLRTTVIIIVLFSGVLIGLLLDFFVKDSGLPFFLGISLIIVIVVTYWLVRRFIIRERKILTTSEGTKKESEVGFVVNTFHELVTKLKNKEKELAELKALAEEKAVRMEAYNENILQSVPSGVVTVDTLMTIKSINQSAEHILGIDAKESVDRNFPDVFNEPLITLIKDDKVRDGSEYPYVTGDGRHIWLGLTTSHLKNAVDETIGSIFIITDLTDIKALQRQVELKQRLSQLGEMSAGISHELRNSMSVITGYAKLLSRQVEEKNMPAANSIMAEIADMDRIITELLNFARPSVLNLSVIDLNKTIKETVSAVAENNEYVRLQMDVEGELQIKADEVLFRQALNNLFMNAVQSMPDGGDLEISSSSAGERAVVLIKDTGDGIPESLREKIFLPFFTTKEKGFGLGLALVQKIIVSHSGNIDVESREGKGTTFIINLPLAS
jgi:PAS domain S-box-containing protein